MGSFSYLRHLGIWINITTQDSQLSTSDEKAVNSNSELRFQANQDLTSINKNWYFRGAWCG
jgi:hypothetical protein